MLPVDVTSTHATYGTQFGVLERPTHRNTPQDQAKFEVCAHMFADLSGPDYGMTICSKDKYGYSVEGNSMRISLLRAPTAPDPNTDEGSQRFSFACIPHVDAFGPRVYELARVLTNPPMIYLGQQVKPNLPHFEITGSRSGSVVLETIKRREDEEGHNLILRMYEATGCHAEGQVVV